MSTYSREGTLSIRNGARVRQATSMPFASQVAMLAWRAILVNIRVPAAIIPPFILGIFFVVIWDAQLGGVAGSFLQGQGYLGFIAPLSIISSVLSGAIIAGQTIVNDITKGYFDKLLLTPVNRWALLLGPMIAGAVLLAAQTTVILMFSILLGMKSVTGIAGLLAVIGFATLLGVGFSGLMVGVALLTGNGAATSGISFLFFPLTFLTATFVPVEQLDGWLEVAARINPITYILEATRAIINTGWESDLIAQGLISSLSIFVVLFGFALYGLRVRTRRR